MMEKEKQWFIYIYVANICTRCLSETEREREKSCLFGVEGAEVWSVGGGNLVEDTVDTAKRGDSLLI